MLQPPQAAPADDAVAEVYALFLQSRALEQDGKVEDAIAALRRAALLLPRAAEVQAELAGLFAREGRAAEAVTAGEAALAIDPDNREAHRMLGFVQAAVAGDPGYAASASTLRSQAIGHLERVVDATSADLSAQLMLGRLYALSGQHAKALPVIRSFLNAQPGYPEALLLLAESAEHLERWDEASSAWTQVIELGPRGRTYRGRQATALVKLGDQYFQLKRYKEAADAFDRALVGDRTAFDAVDVTRKRDRARELAGK